MNHEGAPVELEVWMDVQCTWCYLNSRRLQAALDRFEGPSSVKSRFFELNPDAPDRIDIENLLRVRGMSAESLRESQGRFDLLASEYGLAYNWERIKPTNSRRAHRLLAWAEHEGKRSEMTERLYRGYFIEGADLSNALVLRQLAHDVRLEADAAEAIVNSSTMDSQLDADRVAAQALGLTGVPFTVVGGRFGLSGAQSEEGIVNVLRQAQSGQLG